MSSFTINNIKYNYSYEFSDKLNLTNNWKQTSSLIDYCENLGIQIPHYCYHKSLSIAGNCRMCLIELKNSPKPIVSCALTAKSSLNNTVIYTNSSLVKKARENIMEFLLLNHPLDCPVCDQGGECDLQDQSLFFGFTKKRFYNFKRVVKNKNLGPIVKTVMSRCIHCTRCVRFADEITGVKTLGVFGRGVLSEIGTYTEKPFDSELSGNLIDICPVGALTSKPYPFVSRNWELENVKIIDFSDSFGCFLTASLKNNQISKISPAHDDTGPTWISDKSRFSFDSFISPEKLLKTGFYKTVSKKFEEVSWCKLFNEINKILYFFAQLNKHLVTVNILIIFLQNNISIELLNVINILTTKFSFIKIKKFTDFKASNCLESDFSLNCLKNSQYLNSANLLFLIGINTRYESSYLNLKLRKRFLKGNFEVLTLNSFINNMVSTTYLGLNVNNIKSIIEGNNIYCQKFTNETFKTIILLNSDLIKRKDGEMIVSLFKYFKKYLKNLNLNFLNSSLSTSTLTYFNSYKTVSLGDLELGGVLYFINVSSKSSLLTKLINLRLLNYTSTVKKNDYYYPYKPNIAIIQNNGFFTNISNKLLLSESIPLIFNFANSSFFESTGSYYNTEGLLKKSFKFITAKNNVKEDWSIIRKLINSLDTSLYTLQSSSRLVINIANLIFLKRYSYLLYMSISSLCLNKFKANSISNLIIQPNVKYKFVKKKIFNTKIQLWINDFYLETKGFDSYRSKVMLKCSQNIKINFNNFTYIL